MSQLNAQIEALEKHLESLSPKEYEAVLSQVVESTDIWESLPGPQREAYDCPADILFFGGQAGGSKTDLVIGLALTGPHNRSIIFRRESTQLVGIIQRFQEILKSKDGYSGQDKIWNLPDRTIEFGSCKDVGDEIKYQGRAHSLKAFDEICHFQESQFRFLCGWLRTADPNERQRIVCTGNPPTDSDGEWVIRFWAPWLDKNHPYPAEPGELRYYVTFKNGTEHEVDGPEPVRDPQTMQLVTPKSRTFIPSSVDDNPYLLKTGYKDTLYALPEPLRSQMAEGDFSAGLEDDEWQLIDSDHVQAAMDRWVTLNPKPPMDSIGVDPARGGRDKFILSRRHDGWFDELVEIPGRAVPGGAEGAALVVQYRRDGAPVHIDLIGIGASVYDHLEENGIQTVGINAANKSSETDKTGKLKMRNKRSAMYWAFKEALDPRSDSLIALPHDPELKADLCAPKWKLTSGGVLIESKQDIFKRLGRSTDKGDAVVMAYCHTEKNADEEEEEYYYEERNATTGY